MLETAKDLPVEFAPVEQEPAFNLADATLPLEENDGPLGFTASRALLNEPAREHWLDADFDETVEKRVPGDWKASSCLSSCGDATEEQL